MLGRHINHSQRNRLIAISAIIGTVVIAWIVWPSGGHQTPVRAHQNAPSSSQVTVSPVPAKLPESATTTTVAKSVPNGTKAQVNGVNPAYSSTSAVPSAIPDTVSTGTPAPHALDRPDKECVQVGSNGRRNSSRSRSRCLETNKSQGIASGTSD